MSKDLKNCDTYRLLPGSPVNPLDWVSNSDALVYSNVASVKEVKLSIKGSVVFVWVLFESLHSGTLSPWPLSTKANRQKTKKNEYAIA